MKSQQEVEIIYRSGTKLKSITFELEEEINEALQNGIALLGPISILKEGDYFCVYATLVKYKEEPALTEL